MESVGQYLASFAYDLIFFSGDVQTTTIDMAITGSLCCSIMWAVVHLVTLVQENPSQERSKGGYRCGSKLMSHSQYSLVSAKSASNKRQFDVCLGCSAQIGDKLCRCGLCQNCCQDKQQCLINLSDSVNRLHPCHIYVSVAKHVDLSHHQLDRVPQRLCFLGSQLTYLNLSTNNLSNLPPDIACLQGLTNLHLSSNRLTNIPETFSTLHSLSYLDLKNNILSHIPDSLWTLPSLKSLNVEGNQLRSLSEDVQQLDTLEELFLGFNQLVSLPRSVGHLLNLRILSLTGNPLTSLPDSIGRLLSLQLFNLSYCQLQSLPVSISGCVSLTTLDIGHNQLTQIPFELAELHQLEELYLTDNNITCLPATMENMKLSLLEGTPISRSEFISLPYSDIHEVETFPSLLELAARSLSIYRVPRTQLLPAYLQEMLKKEQFCTRCRCPVFRVFHSRIRKGLIGKYSQVVPLWEILCFKHLPGSAMDGENSRTN